MTNTRKIQTEFWNADEAFRYFYKRISKHGTKFADTRALFNIGISPDWKHELHHWQIDIKIGNGKVHTDPNRYSDENVHENVIKY